MPTTPTANLGLLKPEVGASRDTWGGTLNDDLDKLDNFVAMAMPIGSVIDFAGSTPPNGWLLCDGRLVSRTTYSDLFAAIGTAWGAGDGTTTFKLPPSSGRASIGTGSVTDSAGHVTAFTFAQTAGVINSTILQMHLPNYNLSVNTIAAHNHGGVTGAAGAHSHTVSSGSFLPGPQMLQSGPYSFGADATTSTAPDHTHSITADGGHTHIVALNGGGQAFSNLTPYIVMTKIIYAGAQASTTMALAAPVTTTDSSDELAAIREELAALRAILAPARRRVVSSPLRGVH